ncbi:MAG: hypothetical protein ABIP71_14600, partial [Verrucomicrobiota bacterium]
MNDNSPVVASGVSPDPATGRTLHLSPNQRAWRRFRRNRPAVVSSFFMLAILLLILIWPTLSKPKLASHLPKAMAQ